MIKWISGLLCLLILTACSSSQPIDPGTSSLYNKPPSYKKGRSDDFSVPVIQDRSPGKILSKREGARLKPRQGYWIDRSLHTRGENQRIHFLVLHYTAGNDQQSIDALTNGAVGVHYLVTNQPANYRQRPVVYQLADEQMRTWHAGMSAWGNRHNLNDTSIGIEIVNPGYTRSLSGRVYAPYSESQIRLIIALARDIVKRYDIPPTHVLGHADIAPGRKTDPGPFFPWEQLYRAGIGAWPDHQMVLMYKNRFAGGHMPSVRVLQRGLATYGYSIEPTGRMDNQTKQVLISFQMHFRPTNYSGHYDLETAAILFSLLNKYDGEKKAQSLLNESE